MTTKKFFVAALVCCLSLGFSSKASANSWRVNSDKRANANFQDLNAAMADERVADGDTLYMDKRCTIAAEQTISKKVTIIGPGYFIGENDADEAYFSNSINLEADGIKLTGLHISNVNIRENNAVIERCRVTGNIVAAEKYENDNACIRSCFIVGQLKGQEINGSDEWVIANNIIIRDGTFNNFEWAPIRGFDNALIDHNVIRANNNTPGYSGYGNCLFHITASTITNNIIIQESNPSEDVMRLINSDHNNIISHNLFSNYDLAQAYPNNIKGIGIDIFTQNGANRQRDVFYRLTEENPAKGYAEDGSDCGPYAGAFPYVENGYPLYVPRFESITIPSQPDTNGNLPVRIVVKNQNQ